MNSLAKIFRHVQMVRRAVRLGDLSSVPEERFVDPTVLNVLGRDFPSGVYLIFNRKNGKVYVGSSVNIKGRLRGHLKGLVKGTHGNRYLQRAWDKHGAEAFVTIILKRCPPTSCLGWEQHWIDQLGSCDKDSGYNLCPTAGSCLGIKLTDEHKENIGEGGRKFWASEEGKKQLEKHSQRSQKMWEDPEYRVFMVGVLNNPETRKKGKISIAKTRGTPESRARTSKASRKMWKNEKSRNKLLKSQRSEENRNRLSNLHKGLWADPAYRAKVAANYTKEYRKEIAEKVKERWASPERQKQFRESREARYKAEAGPHVKQIARRYASGEAAVHITKDLDITYQSLKWALEQEGVPYRTQKQASQLLSKSMSKQMREMWKDPEFRKVQGPKISEGMARALNS